MTYNEWEGLLLGYLKSLPSEEKAEITAYYKEMYGDKKDSGLSDSEILETFGDPKLCAARILMENADSAESEGNYPENAANEAKKSEKAEKNTETAQPVLKNTKDKTVAFFKSLSPAKIIGWLLISVLIIIPLASVLISVMAVFASVTVGGAAIAVGGIVIGVASPFGLAVGYSISNVLTTLGLGLCTCGVGILLAISFYYITKYSVISCFKICKYFVRRRK